MKITRPGFRAIPALLVAFACVLSGCGGGDDTPGSYGGVWRMTANGSREDIWVIYERDGGVCGMTSLGDFLWGEVADGDMVVAAKWHMGSNAVSQAGLWLEGNGIRGTRIYLGDLANIPADGLEGARLADAEVPGGSGVWEVRDADSGETDILCIYRDTQDNWANGASLKGGFMSTSMETPPYAGLTVSCPTGAESPNRRLTLVQPVAFGGQ